MRLKLLRWVGLQSPNLIGQLCLSSGRLLIGLFSVVVKEGSVLLPPNVQGIIHSRWEIMTSFPLKEGSDISVPHILMQITIRSPIPREGQGQVVCCTPSMQKLNHDCGPQSLNLKLPSTCSH